MQLKNPFSITIDRQKLFIALFFFILALTLRINHLIHKPELWQDEKYQIESMHGSFWNTVNNLPQYDHTAYLAGDFMLIHPFYKMFGENKYGLAIPHIIFTILGLIFFYLIIRKYLKSRMGFIIALTILTFNRWLIFHATEIRTYAVLPTLALMIFYYGEILIDENKKLSSAKRIALVLFFIFVIWFHVYGIFMIFCIMFFHVLQKSLWKKNSKTFWWVVRFFTLVIVIAMPLWLYSSFGPHLDVGKERNIFQYIANPLTNPIGFAKDIFCNLISLKVSYPLLLAIVIPFFISYPERNRHIGFFLTLIIFPILTIFTLAVLSHYFFLQRQFIWVMPFFAIYLAMVWEEMIALVGRRWKTK